MKAIADREVTVMDMEKYYRKRKRIKVLKAVRDYAVIFVIGFVMVYPILIMFFSSFKTNIQIYNSTKLLPESFNFKNFIEGWTKTGMSYTLYFANTFKLVIPTTLFTVMSSCLVAYGFARFRFPLKKLCFMMLIATLMLPQSVTLITRYTMFAELGWLDSYLPFWIPALLCTNAFFPYMLIQFIRGLPKELDESAYVDGAGTFTTLVRILLPLMKPALFSAGVFQFLWSYNDYYHPLIYINSVKNYPVSLALRLSIDSEEVTNWGQVMAMSFVVVLPVIILYFFAQKSFVEGIATSGMKE